jgi:ferric-dicitrate binding protein FerR (iron transport regulator)
MYCKRANPIAMTQEYIRLLAKKFLEGTATEQEKHILHTWYDRENLEMPESELVSLNKDENADAIKNRIWQNLKSAGASEVKKAKFTWARRLSLWTSAAAAVIIAGFLIWTNKQKPPVSGIHMVQAPLGQKLEITLPDGSSIWLNAGSVLTYPDSFSGKTREVVLKEGQAFFDIVHLADKPFIVHAKTLDITVLGTSFDVKAYHNDPDIKVTVKTGKVGVKMRDKPETPALMLLPAEQAVMPQKAAHIEVNEVSKPAIAPWKDNRMVFEDELLIEVFHALERKYNMHIVVEKADLTQEKISLTVDNQPATDVLKVLSFSKHFNYSQLNDSTIVIR